MYKDKLEQAYKRLAIVSSGIAILLAIPALYLCSYYKEWSFQFLLAYMMFVCLGVLISPKIVNKIWK